MLSPLEARVEKEAQEAVVTPLEVRSILSNSGAMGQTSRESRYGYGAEMCCSSSQPAHIGRRQATREAVVLRVGRDEAG